MKKDKDNWRSEGSACATEVSPKTWFMLMLFTLTYQGNIIFTFSLFFPHYSRPSKPKSHETDRFWNDPKLISKSHSPITQPLTYDQDQAIFLSSAPNTFRNSPAPHNLHLCFHPPPSVPSRQSPLTLISCSSWIKQNLTPHNFKFQTAPYYPIFSENVI
jgi:hypothetical protein